MSHAGTPLRLLIVGLSRGDAKRDQVLTLVLAEGVPVGQAARLAGVSLSTARGWVRVATRELERARDDGRLLREDLDGGTPPKGKLCDS